MKFISAFGVSFYLILSCAHSPEVSVRSESDVIPRDTGLLSGYVFLDSAMKALPVQEDAFLDVEEQFESETDQSSGQMSKVGIRNVDRPKQIKKANEQIAEDASTKVSDPISVAVKQGKNVDVEPHKTIGLHDEFNRLLQQYVGTSGRVNYAAFKSDKATLEGYLAKLGAIDVESLPSRSAKMAFWINLYNAATIDLILANYPLESILELDDGKTWDVKRVQAKNGPLSLNEIEHEILRPNFEDARIHFAVNCAAISCPPLVNQAFTASNLDQLLNERTIAFVNASSYNDLSNPSSIKLSKIFDWYKVDFKPNVTSYIKRFLHSDNLIAEDTEIVYLEYDWSLNSQ